MPPLIISGGGGGGPSGGGGGSGGSSAVANAGNPIIGYGDWSDEATLTTTAAVEGTNVLAHLQSDQPTDVASLDASDTVTIVCDRGVSAPWNDVHLLFTNLTATASWRVRASDDLGALESAPDVDSGDMAFWAGIDLSRRLRRHGWVRHVPDAASRYIRLDITDLANPDGWIRIGRLIIGKFHQFGMSQSVGRTYGYADHSKSTVAVGGPKIFTRVEPVPTQSFAIALLREDDVEDFLDDIVRVCGSSRPVVAMIRPDLPKHAQKNLVYGPLEVGPKTKEEWFEQYEQTIAVEGMP